MHTAATEPIAMSALAPTERHVSVLAAVEADAAPKEARELAGDGDMDDSSDIVVKTGGEELLLGALADNFGGCRRSELC
jgi:hypothetical protein